STNCGWAQTRARKGQEKGSGKKRQEKGSGVFSIDRVWPREEKKRGRGRKGVGSLFRALQNRLPTPFPCPGTVSSGSSGGRCGDGGASFRSRRRATADMLGGMADVTQTSCESSPPRGCGRERGRESFPLSAERGIKTPDPFSVLSSSVRTFAVPDVTAPPRAPTPPADPA